MDSREESLYRGRKAIIQFESNDGVYLESWIINFINGKYHVVAKGKYNANTKILEDLIAERYKRLDTEKEPIIDSFTDKLNAKSKYILKHPKDPIKDKRGELYAVIGHPIGRKKLKYKIYPKKIVNTIILTDDTFSSLGLQSIKNKGL